MMRHLVYLIVLFPLSLFGQQAVSDSILDDYPWISIEFPECDGLEFEEYDNGAYAYLYATNGALYFQDGTYYCGDGVDRDCRALYGLSNGDISRLLSCQSDDSSDEGADMEEEQNDTENDPLIQLFIDTTFVFVGDEFCVDLKANAIEDLLSFQFQIQQSNDNLRVILSSSDALPDVFTLIANDVAKFLWISDNLKPVDIDEGTILATICYSVVDDDENLTQISLLNTERLFAQFITATSTGDFFENTDISVSGGQVHISSVAENDMTEESDDAMDEDMSDVMDEDMSDVIDEDMSEESQVDDMVDESGTGIPLVEYPWIAEIIDRIGCEGTRITEYDFGHYSFLYFTNDNIRWLYSTDGAFYCEQKLTRDCEGFYQLAPDKIVNEWQCQP